MEPVSLQTGRLVLRQPTPDDAEALAVALNDEAISQWLARVPYPYDVNDAIRFIGICEDNWQRDIAYPLNAFEDGKPIGGIGITRVSDTDGVLGYWLIPAKWRQGYGREMMQEILDFAFNTLGFTELSAGIHPDNERSGGLLLACDFESIGDQIYLHPPRDARLKGPHFRLTLDQYRARQRT